MTSNAEGARRLASIPRSGWGRVAFDPQWCRTCRVCEALCSALREGAASPALARINVLFDEFQEVDPVSATVCRQCGDAVCAEACPAEAMVRDQRTGAIAIDEERCVGCLECRTVCPWDVPKMHPERSVAIKCDLCSERDEGPVCVQVCPLAGRALRHERWYEHTIQIEGASQ